MKLYALEDLQDSRDYLAPHGLNAEAAQVVTRANRLDRWALNGRLAHTKIAPDAFGRVRYVAIGTTQTYDMPAIEAPAVVAGLSASDTDAATSSTIPVLDALGEPWVATIETRGGYLEVSAHVDVDGLADVSASPEELQVWRLVVLVDGLRAAISPPAAALNAGRAPIRATGHVPIGAGSILVELLLEVVTEGNVAAKTITFRDRQLLLVEACR